MEPIKVKDKTTGEIKLYAPSPSGEMVEIKATGNDHNQFISGYSQVDAGKEYSERQAKNKELDYQRELALRGPASQARAEVAKNTHPLKKMGLLAMDEIKSLYHGGKDIAHDIHKINDRLTASMPGVFPGERSQSEIEDYSLDAQDRRKERDIDKINFREMDESAGLTQIARMAPYSFTGLFEAPIASLYSRGIKGITDITRKGLPRAVNPGGRPSILSEYLGAGTLGAIEGGLHEDEDIFQGAGSSIIGRFGGRTLGNFLEKAPNSNSPFESELIERWRKKGYVASPGMRIGNQKEQIHDAAQSSHPRYSEWYAERDRVNNDVFAEEMKKAAGFKMEGDMSSLTPETINRHMGSLSAEYKVLEDNTKGIIPVADFDRINDNISELSDVDIGSVIKDFKMFADGDMSVDRVFDGKSYQDQLRMFKQGKRKALGDSNTRLADIYDDMMTSLASGLEGGMKKDQVERWRDLNERYAMSKLLIEKGIGPTQRVDSDKLLNAITSADMDRLVTGKGGRIRDFHDIVRMKHLDNQQKSPGMGEGIADLSDKEKKARLKAKPTFWSGPEKSGTTPVDKARMNFQYNGLFGQPRKVFGLLGNPREGIFSTGAMMRALEQGTDSKRNIYDYVTEPEERYKDAKSYVTSLLGN